MQINSPNIASKIAPNPPPSGFQISPIRLNQDQIDRQNLDYEQLFIEAKQNQDQLNINDEEFI